MNETVTYHDWPDGPMRAGTNADGAPYFVFGYYRVDLGDFVYMSPSVGTRADPIDDPDFDAFLIGEAERTRDKHKEAA